MSDQGCIGPVAPDIYGSLPTANKVFRVYACYHEVAHDCLNWDPVYCTSLMMYCVLSVLNICMVIYVFRYYKDSILEGNIYSKVKTWILILCLTMYTILFLRNFFENISPKISLGMLYVSQICCVLIYMLVAHFFLKAAASLVGKGRV